MPITGSRVVIACKFYAPAVGGIETILREQAEFLARQGYQVTVLCCAEQRTAVTTREQINGVEVVRCASLGTYLSMPLSIGFMLEFRRLSRAAKIIHVHAPFPLVDLALALFDTRHARLLVTWHADIVRQRITGVVARWLQHRVCARAQAILVNSQALAEQSPMLQRYRSKVQVSVPWLDPPAAARKPVEFAQDGPSSFALYLGRLSGYKGIDVLARALPQLNLAHIRLVVAGAGDTAGADAFDQALHCLRIARVFDEEEKSWLLEHCRFLVFPSTTPSEAFGMVQLEAMRAGKPVLNTQLPTGVPWVSLHQESGLTIQPGDAAALAAAFNRLVDDEMLRVRLGHGAQQRFNKLFAMAPAQEALGRLYADGGSV